MTVKKTMHEWMKIKKYKYFQNLKGLNTMSVCFMKIWHQTRFVEWKHCIIIIFESSSLHFGAQSSPFRWSTAWCINYLPIDAYSLLQFRSIRWRKCLSKTTSVEKQEKYCNFGMRSGLPVSGYLSGCLAAFKSQTSELFTIQGWGGWSVGGYTAVISALL